MYSAVHMLVVSIRYCNEQIIIFTATTDYNVYCKIIKDYLRIRHQTVLTIHDKKQKFPF